MRSLPLFFALFFCTSVGWTQGLHAVDFANRVWTHTCLGTVRTHRGSSRQREPGSGAIAFRVGPAAFGDLDGDGVDEAVVPTQCACSFVNPFGDATVFTWRGGQLREVAYLGVRADQRGGDGEYDILDSVRIERGVILEERPVDDRGGRDRGYVATYRRALRRGRIVEAAPATVACRPTRAEGCVPPSELPSEVHFEPSHMAATRPLTFDASGNLPTLSLWMLEGQDLSVDVWCGDTEPALVRVEPPAGPAVESESPVGYVHAHAARSGRYRVSFRAREAVGLCYARLGVHVVAFAHR